MKQMRFITSDAETVTAFQKAIVHKGIYNGHFRVFSRGDTDLDLFDSFSPDSDDTTSDRHLRTNITVFVLYFMFAAAMISTNALDFFAVSLMLLVSLAFYCARSFYLLFSIRDYNSQMPEKDTVYYVELDVDELEEKSISKITQKLPDLVSHH